MNTDYPLHFGATWRLSSPTDDALPDELIALRDEGIPIVSVPSWLTGDCTACLDELAADRWNVLDVACRVVSASHGGRRYEQEACSVHASMYVREDQASGRPVVIEVPVHVTEAAA